MISIQSSAEVEEAQTKACTHYDAHCHTALKVPKNRGYTPVETMARERLQQAENTNQAISKQLASDSDTAL